jgi:hypothetical protein
MKRLRDGTVLMLFALISLIGLALVVYWVS